MKMNYDKIKATADRLKKTAKVRLNTARKWLKSYIYAPTRSVKGERTRLFLFGMVGLMIGIGTAVFIQTSNEAEDRRVSIQEQMLQHAIPPAGRGEKRWLAMEQLKLLLSK